MKKILFLIIVACVSFFRGSCLLADDTNQLMNLPSSTENRFDISDRVWPTKYGEADVCLWEDDKMIAVSHGIDDNVGPEHEWWIEMGDKYGFSFTWFVIVYPYMYDYDGSDGTNQSFFGNLEDFQILADAGHDIQVHGTCDINDLPDEDYESDAVFAKETLEKIENNRVLTYAYPCGDASGNHKTIIAEHFNAARGVVGGANKANNIDYLNTRKGVISAETIDAMIDRSDYKYYRGWLIALSHYMGIEDKRAVVEEDLIYVHSRIDDIWMGKFKDISRYGQERDSHTLLVNSVVAGEIRLSLTDTMSDVYFDYPLTVKVRVGDDWKNLYATQGAETIAAKMIRHEGVNYALLKVVPDEGEVVLSASQDVETEEPSVINFSTLDINHDKTVGVADAKLIFKKILGLEVSNWSSDVNTGDANCDEQVNIFDSILTFKKALGMNMRGTSGCREEYYF